MENDYKNVSLLQKRKLKEEQTAIENNIIIDSDQEIKKVLSVSAKVDVNDGLECLQGECNVSGNVILNVVYVMDDGSINNQTTTSPFNYKIVDEQLNSNCKINVCVGVVGTDINKLVANQIKIVTTVCVKGIIVKNIDVPVLGEVENGVYVKHAEQEIVTFAKQTCERFEEELQANVTGGVKKILSTDIDYVIDNYTLGTNFAVIEGELYAKIVYINGAEIPELETVTISKKFKQEIEVEGANKECLADIFMHVVNGQVEVQIDEKDSETAISVKVPLLACCNLYENTSILVCKDVYSTQNVISISQSDCVNYVNLAPEVLESKIEGSVVLTDEEPRIDKYITTTNVQAGISNTYVDNGSLFIEGVVSANVIYLNDEQDGLQSVQIEIPFVLDGKTQFDTSAILDATICLYDVDVMVKRGREIYFDAKVKVFVRASKQTDFCMVTKIENIDVLPAKDSALEIYFAKAGESFWDIAKNLKIPSEIISSQNPNLVEPLEKDQNIAIYYQKERKAGN